MKLQFYLKFLLACTFTACVVLLKCSPPSGGGGTDIPPGYVGMLFFEDSRPAANVAVRIVKYREPREVAGNLGKALYDTQRQYEDISLVTDDMGRIILGDLNLKNGFYQIHAEAGKLKSFTDSVYFVDNKCEEVYDTLRETGSLRGRVVLDCGSDPRSVEIYIFGIKSNFFVEDREGNFTLDFLAEGNYHVRFVSSIDRYLPLDTFIHIGAGRHDTLVAPVVLPNVVMISEFSYTIDTLMRSVTLFWNRIDETQISGYQLGTMEGEPVEGVRTILKDTSITLYLKDSIKARVRALDLDNDPIGSFTSPIEIKAVNLAEKKTVFSPVDSTRFLTPVDSVRASGWTLLDDRFYILRSSRYVPDSVRLVDAKIDIIDTSGKRLSTLSLKGKVNNPLAVSSYNDSVYILDKKNSDSICLLKINDDELVTCSRNLSFITDITSGTNFEFGRAGSIFISQFMTTAVIRPDGSVLTIKNGINSKFSITDSWLYTNIQGLPWRVVKYSLNEDSLVATDQIFYDKYKLINNVDPKFFVANNKGIICCLIELSLFVFDEQKKFKARLYIKDAAAVSDCELTEENLLYLLYINEKIDVIDLNKIISRFY